MKACSRPADSVSKRATGGCEWGGSSSETTFGDGQATAKIAPSKAEPQNEPHL